MDMISFIMDLLWTYYGLIMDLLLDPLYSCDTLFIFNPILIVEIIYYKSYNQSFDLVLIIIILNSLINPNAVLPE